jgi:hypothetical protein
MKGKREFAANVTPANGGTQTVLVRAHDASEAKRLLTQMGYRDVRNVAAI